MTVPAGTIAYWPVAMLSLPDGLAQIGTPSVVSATLDAVNHSPNPMIDGIRELRFFLNTLDNQANNKDANVLIKFDTLATVTSRQLNSTVWSNCCQGTATVSAYAVGMTTRLATTTGRALRGMAMRSTAPLVWVRR